MSKNRMAHVLAGIPPEPKAANPFVVNRRSGLPWDVYVGRPSKWGNPFKVGRDGTRAECLAKYETWLLETGRYVDAANELRGKVLACWCAPLSCHADILARYANA